jgi:transposase InsO family protein
VDEVVELGRRCGWRRGELEFRLHTPAGLVNRQFTATRPNELWCTDISEHPARDGKVHCCAILDCFSKMIAARTFSTIADTGLVNNAVNMAVASRTRYGATTLHADHGSPFTSWSRLQDRADHPRRCIDDDELATAEWVTW